MRSLGSIGLVEAFEAAEAQRQTLRATSDADEACYGAVLYLLLDREIG